MKMPPVLNQGDTIGVMAPSCALDKYKREKLGKAVRFLEDAGFKVFVHPQTFSGMHGARAGLPRQQADALHDLYQSPEIKAIFTAWGGEGAADVAECLDYDLIGRNPKIIMGFSDVTVLLNAISNQTGQVTFHGPMMCSFADKLPESHMRQCFNLLAGKQPHIPIDKAQTLVPGTAQGLLAGGNLTRVSESIGTSREPKWDDAILFFEDVEETLEKYRHMLTDMKGKGFLGRAAALIFGSFSKTDFSGKEHSGKNLFGNMLRELTEDMNIPIIINAPFGHARKLVTLPVGAQAHLVAEKDSVPALTISELR